LAIKYCKEKNKCGPFDKASIEKFKECTAKVEAKERNRCQIDLSYGYLTRTKNDSMCANLQLCYNDNYDTTIGILAKKQKDSLVIAKKVHIESFADMGKIEKIAWRVQGKFDELRDKYYMKILTKNNDYITLSNPTNITTRQFKKELIEGLECPTDV